MSPGSGNKNSGDQGFSAGQSSSSGTQEPNDTIEISEAEYFNSLTAERKKNFLL
jgi:hypothetical protein